MELKYVLIHRLNFKLSQPYPQIKIKRKLPSQPKLDSKLLPVWLGQMSSQTIHLEYEPAAPRSRIYKLHIAP